MALVWSPTVGAMARPRGIAKANIHAAAQEGSAAHFPRRSVHRCPGLRMRRRQQHRRDVGQAGRLCGVQFPNLASKPVPAK